MIRNWNSIDSRIFFSISVYLSFFLLWIKYANESTRFRIKTISSTLRKSGKMSLYITIFTTASGHPPIRMKEVCSIIILPLNDSVFDIHRDNVHNTRTVTFEYPNITVCYEKKQFWDRIFSDNTSIVSQKLLNTSEFR